MKPSNFVSELVGNENIMGALKYFYVVYYTIVHTYAKYLCLVLV